MPNDTIKSYAEKTGKSVSEVEKLWQEAKKAAGESYSESDSDKFYGTAMKILKRKLNLSEERITFASYVRGGACARVRVCEGMDEKDFVKTFVNAGKANEKGLKESDVDQKELAKGIEVEYEHTTDKDIAKRIALDHLAELPDYYTRLAKMEEEGKKELKDK
jgi:hypothetical protein